MIDIKFLRENPEVVKENIRKKFQEHKLPLVDEVIELDEQARKTQQEADEIRANRNKLSKQIGMLMGQGKNGPLVTISGSLWMQRTRKSGRAGCSLSAQSHAAW